MGVQVTFNYDLWRSRYPEFSQIDKVTIDLYAVQSQIYHANDGAGPVANVDVQQMLMGLVTAHICQLMTPSRGVPQVTGSPQLVGAIVSAQEGSVDVETQNDYPPGTPQWWQQTTYGSAYYAATASYRTMMYRPGRRTVVDPFMFRGPVVWLG